ncbi:MAG: hypothetical protein L0I62_01160 [Gammaproteobacteria bacterium]|nr:hypothetical protein [Gammaproteobacteria bacterium]
MNKSLIFVTITLIGGLLALAGCSRQETLQNRNMTPAQLSVIKAKKAQTPPASTLVGGGRAGTVASPEAAATANLPHLAYMALLYPLNSSVTGHSTAGKAQFAIDGDKLTIRVNVVGSPPDIEHWQHIHGFVSGEDAQCPQSLADINGDGIIDLIETHAASGITMVPLNDDPTAMKVATHTYPTASAEGSYMYQQTVSLDALQEAFGAKFDGDKLNLANRVIYVHGVPETTQLPASVSSLPGAPAYITIPIACGEITAVPQSLPAPST